MFKVFHNLTTAHFISMKHQLKHTKKQNFSQVEDKTKDQSTAEQNSINYTCINKSFMLSCLFALFSHGRRPQGKC